MLSETSSPASRLHQLIQELDVMRPCEAADALRVSERVVRQLLRTQQLTGLKVGGQWRIRPTDLMAYILNQMQKG